MTGTYIIEPHPDYVNNLRDIAKGNFHLNKSDPNDQSLDRVLFGFLPIDYQMKELENGNFELEALFDMRQFRELGTTLTNKKGPHYIEAIYQIACDGVVMKYQKSGYKDGQECRFS